MKTLSLALIGLGIVASFHGGTVYGSRQLTLREVGAAKVTSTEHKTLPISPLLWVTSPVIGAGMLVWSKRRPRR